MTHEHTHAHGHDHSHNDGAGHGDGLADLLDLDAQVLHAYWADALGMAAEAVRATPASPTDPTAAALRIIDLGAGTGTAAVAFAERFGSAEVLAVDASEAMLDRIAAKARVIGVGDRVRLVHADLDQTWPELGTVDLTWASMSLHHLADPDGALRRLLAVTRAGGVVAVAEFSESIRFLPDDLGIGEPGLEARCLAVLDEQRRHTLPEIGSDWPSRLDRAGFGVVENRTFAIDVAPPPPAAAVQYAQGWLARLRAGLADQLAASDAETLSALLDGDGPHSLARRADLHIRGFRTVTLARKPD